MFSALLFAQDGEAARTIEQAARESGQVCIYKSITRLPKTYELTRLLNCFEPDVLFIDLRDLEKALVVARTLRAICRDAAIIGFCEGYDEFDERDATRAGVQEILTSPVTLHQFEARLERAMRKARPAPQDNLLAFLPAKAGCGCTTIALNVAGALAHELGQRALVIEADLRSGVLSVLLKLSAKHSIVAALDNSTPLDDTLWANVVTHADSLDLLLSPRPESPIVVSWGAYHRLLEFVKPRYDTVVADLPEVINDASVEIVRRAGQIFVVTTAELPALVLARQRRQELAKWEIAADRVQFILNRWTKAEIRVEQVEEFLGGPVGAVIQNDYQGLRRAIQDGRLVGKKSALGRSFAALALRLTGSVPPVPESTTRGFGLIEALAAR